MDCKVDGCERVHYCHGFCVMHDRRNTRHGDPYTVLASGSPPGDKHPRWLAEGVGYIGMHKRIYAELGKASLYPCSAPGCTAQAKQWAYDHLDPDQKTEIQDGYLVSFSTHIEHYVPMCVPCQKKLDLSRKEVPV